MDQKQIIFPEPLKKGDKIAIISPATIVKEEYIDGAADFLSTQGYNPLIMPAAKGPSKGSFAAEFDSRLKDLKTAIENPEIKAILCARGGYGCVHLLPHLSEKEIRQNPKWIIGFSDISALHALWLKSGVASIHGPMAKHLTEEQPTQECTLALMELLQNGGRFDYRFPGNEYNREGRARGVLRGGNLAVLNGLAASGLDILHIDDNEEVILFLEDVSEAIYAVERMLIRLYLSGTLNKLKGLIIGQFTEYKPDRNYQSMEEMIDSLLRRLEIDNLPVAFDFPCGHVSLNYPLVEGASVELSVTKEDVLLSSI